MNRIIKAALSALSKYDVDLKNRYEEERCRENKTRPYYNKLVCNRMDRIVHLHDRDILVRCFSRDGKPAPLLVFYHGGGFVTGDFDSYNHVAADLAIRTGYNVLSVDYRLAPEHKFPAGPEDCYEVTQEIFRHSEDWYQAKREDIALIGDSAGATLAFMVSLMARDRGGMMPTRQILIYPSALGDYRGYADMTTWSYSEKTPFLSVFQNGRDYILTIKKLNDYMELYASSEEDYAHRYFAPLNNTDYSDLPETLLITMEYDPLRDEGRALAKRMKDAGCDIKTVMIRNGIHGMFSLPSTTPLTSRIYSFILNFLPTQKDEQ